MKKRNICLLLLLITGAAAFIVPVFFPGLSDKYFNWGFITTIMVILTIATVFFEFEANASGSKEIAVVAMLGAISAVARVPFAAIPGLQPCTYLIICSGAVFGPVAGFMVGAMTALVSNFFLGQGPWTPYQMFAWGLTGMSAAAFRWVKPGKVNLIIFGVMWGYLYGWLMNSWFWVSFIYPLTFRTFVVYQLTGFWFDTIHAAGNAVFLALFGEKTIVILNRFKKRFAWSFL
jgi:energy-coupling factor transport system substrate-specific component